MCRKVAPLPVKGGNRRFQSREQRQGECRELRVTETGLGGVPNLVARELDHFDHLAGEVASDR